jgi:ATP-dependent helicase Lhr and Lhr-like helicase
MAINLSPRYPLRTRPPTPSAWNALWLARWGVLMRELLGRQICLPPWRELLLRWTAGTARRGPRRSVRRPHGGEQFGLPGGGSAACRAPPPSAVETVIVAAADPLNLVGIIVPRTRAPPAVLEVIAYREEAVQAGDAAAVRARLERGVA